MSTVLVVAAHPDDEVLGCGGTMARHAAAGDAVHTLIVAEGATARPRGSRAEVRRLADAAKEAGRALGVASTTLLGLPDNRLDTVPLLEIVGAVERVLEKIAPDTVYCHFGNDLNIDHQLVSQAVCTACRPLPGQTVREILWFEVASSTEWQAPGASPAFQPTVFIDIAETLAGKLAALRAYDAEMRPWPHARSYEAVEALARWRGASAGLQAAEAFQPARIVR